MNTKKKNKCDPDDQGNCCCNIEAVMTVDDRGQMVLPKEVRAKADIKPGDKLALVTWEENGQICCMTLIKADQLSNMVKGVLGPIMRSLNET
ncbi:AbrB/MazE/SpoVT family DNA-binding domain-containing protein [bacterium]|nr:AbrB/MazE/SpoVT family DNA-binding domain-containing protein [bacterium]MBU1652039.1 AbrB/MazE/SpoVT family DNA-binding domain-containing protein [bacterium]MBU1882186.1 AbrB/MazE/SpoVT family DNA-binding domain-containing protein [bacterium]